MVSGIEVSRESFAVFFVWTFAGGFRGSLSLDAVRPRRIKSARSMKNAASMAQATINPKVGMVSGPRWRKGITTD